MQGLPREDPTGTPQGLPTRICTRSYEDLLVVCKDLVERASPRSPEEAASTLCASLRNRNPRGVVSCENLWEECRAPEAQQPLCASMRKRNARRHLRRAILCSSDRAGKMPRRRGVATTFCASLRNRNAHGHLRRAIVCDILICYRKKNVPQGPEKLAAQSKCTFTSHKNNFTREFKSNKSQSKWSTLIQPRPLPLS